MSRLVEAARKNPEWKPTTPAGNDASSCMPSAKSGFGKRVNKPSRIIADAPETISSAGWPTSINVPCQRSRFCAMSSAVPTHADMCRSCPHMCATEHGLAGVVLRRRGARERQAGLLLHRQRIELGAQHHGRAGPFFRIATMPVPPTPVVTSKPSAFTRAASVAAVRCS
jgi:hypothetical protein